VGRRSLPHRVHLRYHRWHSPVLGTIKLILNEAPNPLMFFSTVIRLPGRLSDTEHFEAASMSASCDALWVDRLSTAQFIIERKRR
jgi:hypothetical protein